MATIRTHLLDASALVKLFVNEDGSEKLKKYLGDKSVIWTTSLCFAEALGVLKCKCFYRKEITREKYMELAEDLLAHLRNGTLSIVEVDITQMATFNEVEKITKSYSLDLVDAFQIVTMKDSFITNLEGDSKTIFITGDKPLACSAKHEGLRVWNLMKEDLPL